MLSHHAWVLEADPGGLPVVSPLSLLPEALSLTPLPRQWSYTSLGQPDPGGRSLGEAHNYQLAKETPQEDLGRDPLHPRPVPSPAQTRGSDRPDLPHSIHNPCLLLINIKIP